MASFTCKCPRVKHPASLTRRSSSFRTFVNSSIFSFSVISVCAKEIVATDRTFGSGSWTARYIKASITAELLNLPAKKKEKSY